ncbi:MAG: CbiX/SirB N-terminal domain-containing protein [Candidatus Nezhaarchaeales archaeon]|nr:MAG: hypothetical protein DSO05_05860 [Candidatus Nezhaarchaeota archaeon WYZ-LMO7]TDA35199.1 MAG: hypothetical protein DSO06_03120 [Candidatus Nezhaarchaeota archaeon WYZ-LMO8]
MLHKIVEKSCRKVVTISVVVSEGSHIVRSIPNTLKVPRGARHYNKEVNGVEVETIYTKPLGVNERIADIVIDRAWKLHKELDRTSIVQRLRLVQ